MRRFDKRTVIAEANQRLEDKYLKNRGLVKEFYDFDKRISANNFQNYSMVSGNSKDKMVEDQPFKVEDKIFYDAGGGEEGKAMIEVIFKRQESADENLPQFLYGVKTIRSINPDGSFDFAGSAVKTSEEIKKA